MTSYHAFASKLGWYDGSLSSMIRDSQFGIKAWVDHAESWLTQTRPSVSFNVIRYEDLCSDTSGVLSHIYSLLGFAIEADTINAAVENSSFPKMQGNEAFCTKKNLSLPKNFAFVRKGGSNHKEEISAEDLHFIEEQAETTMKIFGYT